jgi:hypothetical protein
MITTTIGSSWIRTSSTSNFHVPGDIVIGGGGWMSNFLKSISSLLGIVIGTIDPKLTLPIVGVFILGRPGRVGVGREGRWILEKVGAVGIVGIVTSTTCGGAPILTILGMFAVGSAYGVKETLISPPPPPSHGTSIPAKEDIAAFAAARAESAYPPALLIALVTAVKA